MSANVFDRWTEGLEERAARIFQARSDIVTPQQKALFDAQHQCRLLRRTPHACCSDIRWDVQQQCVACFSSCEYAHACGVPGGAHP